MSTTPGDSKAEDSRARSWIYALGALGGLGGLGGLATLIPGLGSQHAGDAPVKVELNLSNFGNSSSNNSSAGSGNASSSGNSSHTENNFSRRTQPVTSVEQTTQLNHPPPPPARKLSDYEKYIDPKASRVEGVTNVALVLRGLPGSPAAPLEDAAQRALAERGFSIVPLFREQFQKDGLELRLFRGDASLASRLKLQQHCDIVLLGVLRFVGPAQSVADGHYIREAVLDIHAVDPASGKVVNSLEIREKGGGSSAELSTVHALSRLQEMVEANMSGWSWI